MTLSTVRRCNERFHWMFVPMLSWYHTRRENSQLCSQSQSIYRSVVAVSAQAVTCYVVTMVTLIGVN